MRHLLKLRPHPEGFEASDPHVPSLRPSVGRTPEEAIARFEERLRFLAIEKKASRGWWEEKAGIAQIFFLLCWELVRAAGLWLVGGERGDRLVGRLGLLLLIGVPLVLCVLMLLK